jgi:ankyrin repeat protein
MAERYGGNVNAKNNKGNTALHFTVQFGFNALGDFLVEKGADKDAKNAAGLTPYEGIG